MLILPFPPPDRSKSPKLWRTYTLAYNAFFVLLVAAFVARFSEAPDAMQLSLFLSALFFNALRIAASAWSHRTPNE
jgi:hypothetical protein